MGFHQIQPALEQGQMKSTGRAFNTPAGFLFGWSTTVGGGFEGWAPGALYIDVDAAQGSQVYVNVGSKTSASWVEIADAGVAGGFEMSGASASADLNGGKLILDADGDTFIQEVADDTLEVYCGGSVVGYISLGSGLLNRNVTVTATTDGLTTGLIPGYVGSCTVSSSNANYQISLPSGAAGKSFRLFTGGTGCELIASVAADKVNDVVVGATNELALAANSTFLCWYRGSNEWTVYGWNHLGAALAALVPDART